ncbi:MAG: aryl-sulfate sulfotransferase [Planctomycetota bacterium]|nr:aryl-sulfate sulfotransferase [Planctomycetota bacterium]
MHVTLSLFALLTLQSSDVAPLRAAEKTAEALRGLRTKTDAATPGYTLVAPLRATSTYLIDVDGKVAHEWKSDAPPGQSVCLTDAGKLLRTERVENRTFQGGGQGGRIRELDWDGKVTWEFTLSDDEQCLHHDIEMLPNGNVLAIVWEMRSEEEALAAGRDPASAKGGLWADALIEIEPLRPVGGKIVWEWHAFDHLVQARDAAKPNYAPIAMRPERLDIDAGNAQRPANGDRNRERERLKKIGYVGDDGGAPARGGDNARGGPPGGENDWTHANGLDYRADLDLIVVSSRNLSELWVIDHSTSSAEARTSAGGRHGHGGDFLFRFGNPRVIGDAAGEQKLFVQHDPRWLANGHVLVFNNGAMGHEHSSVDEYDFGITAESLKSGFKASQLPTAKLAWSYTSPDMRSSHISGAQRLANGHTLIAAGEPGLLREVDAEGRVVWDFASPLTGDAGPRMGRPMGRPRDGGGPGRDGAEGQTPRDSGPEGTPPPGGDPNADGPPAGGPGRGPRGGMRGGRGGPEGPFGFFRADHYSAEHPALRALQPSTGTKQ